MRTGGSENGGLKAVKRGKKGGRRKGPSAEQRQGNAAVPQVMGLWEELSDAERLAWNVEGAERRMKGVNYFKKINLRRARRGAELLREPVAPAYKTLDGDPVLKGLRIYNRGGRVTLEVELRKAPAAPRTVWGARPCNRGVGKPDKCPRLRRLPTPKDGVSKITELYFMKHGEYIERNRVQLAGKRIFIRIRQEVDDDDNVYEEANAVVPEPKGSR